MTEWWGTWPIRWTCSTTCGCAWTTIHDTDDCVVVAITFGGRARHSGLEVTLHPVHVFRLRDGRVFHWQIFQEREQALEAVGLRE